VEEEFVDALDPSTPAAANALKIGPMSPPPAGGGVALALECAAPEVLDAPVVPCSARQIWPKEWTGE
jgi:hypothetical protein